MAVEKAGNNLISKYVILSPVLGCSKSMVGRGLSSLDLSLCRKSCPQLYLLCKVPGSNSLSPLYFCRMALYMARGQPRASGSTVLKRLHFREWAGACLLAQ